MADNSPKGVPDFSSSQYEKYSLERKIFERSKKEFISEYCVSLPATQKRQLNFLKENPQSYYKILDYVMKKNPEKIYKASLKKGVYELVIGGEEAVRRRVRKSLKNLMELEPNDWFPEWEHLRIQSNWQYKKDKK